MEVIIKRIAEYLKLSKISTRKFEIAIGASNGAISRAIKNNTDIQSKWMSKIVDIYPDINPEWLITGKGDMNKVNPKEYYQLPDSNLSVNEELGNHLYLPKSLFNKLREANLKDDQAEALKTLEYNYDTLLHQNIGLQKKVIQLYENRDK